MYNLRRHSNTLLPFFWNQILVEQIWKRSYLLSWNDWLTGNVQCTSFLKKRNFTPILHSFHVTRSSAHTQNSLLEFPLWRISWSGSWDLQSTVVMVYRRISPDASCSRHTKSSISSNSNSYFPGKRGRYSSTPGKSVFPCSTEFLEMSP